MNPGTRMGSIAGSLAQEGGAGRAFRDVAVASMSPRRRCTAADTRHVLAEAEACTAPGQVGALWRRAGWSSAPLTTWRRQRAPGVLAALTPQKRGRKAQGLDPLAQRVAPLERDHARLSHQRKQAATILEGPKNVAELLGLAPEGNPPGGRRSWPPRGDERRALAPGRRVRRWACRAPATLVISKAQRARLQVERPASPLALTCAEQRVVWALLPAARVVEKAPLEGSATRLDEGSSHGSIRPMSRLLAREGEVRERRGPRQRAHDHTPELWATGPNPVWSWAITQLQGPVKWRYDDLYVSLAIDSREVGGWMGAHRERAALAHQLMQLTGDKQGSWPGP